MSTRVWASRAGDPRSDGARAALAHNLAGLTTLTHKGNSWEVPAEGFGGTDEKGQELCNNWHKGTESRKEPGAQIRH